MALTKPQFDELLRLLTETQNDKTELKALVTRTFYGGAVLPQIDWDGTLNVVLVEVVQKLDQFGVVAAGKPAIVALLETLHQQVGADRQRQIDRLIAYLLPIPIDDYLDQTLPQQLLETGSLNIRRLEDRFIDLEAEAREQAEIMPATPPIDISVFDEDELFVPKSVRERQAALSIEPHGTLSAPHEVFTGAPENVTNIRERLRAGTMKRVVVVGEPGAGKTFLLGRLALDYRAAYRVEATNPLPIFIPLSKYAKAEPFEQFVAGRLGALAARLPELKVIWLLDALNEMPREQGQKDHLMRFIEQLVKTDTPFVLTCRVKNYESELAHIPHLYRVELQDLNPEQIYTILAHYLTVPIADELWEPLFKGGGLRAAWQEWIEWTAWTRSVREFWERSQLHWWEAIYDDPRKLLLLCRNPFTLVRLIVKRLASAIVNGDPRQPLLVRLQDEDILPNNRAKLFGAVIEEMLHEEAQHQQWSAEALAQVTRTLEFTAQALQAEEQRTEAKLADLWQREEVPTEALKWLRLGRDAGLVTLDATTVRFNHQLFQEYFATQRLRDLLADYDRRYPDWQQGTALPPKDERLVELFPQWWEVGGWRVTVALLGELEGRSGIGRVVRWLASYSFDIAMNVVLDNNDGIKLTELETTAQTALIASARLRIELPVEPNPRGRAMAGRVLGLMNADKRPGIGLRLDRLPDIAWIEIPAGEFIYQQGEKRTLPTFYIAKYPVTYEQYRAFLDAPDFENPQWWVGMPEDVKHHYEQEGQINNHPYENVSWYQAAAFCRWLSMKSGYEVRLPTEFEWEKAARGTGERTYKNYITVVNTRETGIGQTSAVGIFPQGVSPYGVQDMLGNVWEWCLSAYNDPMLNTIENQVNNNIRCILRGGGWNGSHDYARVDCRYYGSYSPTYHYLGIGFRLVSPSIH